MDKILRRRFGVTPDIDMEKGTAILVFVEPTRFDFPAFADTLQRSSHRLRSARLEVAGRFDGPAERRDFIVAGTGQRFSVAPGSRHLPGERVRVRAVVERWDVPALKIEEAAPAP